MASFTDIFLIGIKLLSFLFGLLIVGTIAVNYMLRQHEKDKQKASEPIRYTDKKKAI